MSMPNFPPGYVDENVGPHVVGVAVAFIVLEIFLVAMRFTSRYLNKIPIGLDDIFIIPSLVFCLGICALAIGK